MHLAEGLPRVWAALLHGQSPSRAAAAGRRADAVYPVSVAILNLSTHVAHIVGLDGPDEEIGRPRAGERSAGGQA